MTGLVALGLLTVPAMAGSTHTPMKDIQVALSGFHVPAPAVMSLLGLAGLVTLRRRRL